MSALDKAFQKQKPFLGFVVGGDGGVEYCVDCCLQLIEGGVDILEIGLPFSDPVADGPVIQRAAERSLEQGTTSSTILEIGAEIRKKSDVPLILFTYYNPLYKKGNGFLKELKSAGFDAILVVDLPPPEPNGAEHPYYQAMQEAGLHPIFLISPSTDDTRLAKIAAVGEGFLYYVIQKGTTGVRNKLPEDFSFHISRIRSKTKLPIAAGFGIADRGSAQVALDASDGFVVGSAFVKLMERRAAPSELKLLAQSIDPRT